MMFLALSFLNVIHKLMLNNLTAELVLMKNLNYLIRNS